MTFIKDLLKLIFLSSTLFLIIGVVCLLNASTTTAACQALGVILIWAVIEVRTKINDEFDFIYQVLRERLNRINDDCRDIKRDLAKRG